MEKIVVKIQNTSEGSVLIGIVGKYTSIIDSINHLLRLLTHGGISNKTKVELNG